MKRILLSFAILTAACALPLSAARLPQKDGNSVDVQGTEVTRTVGGTVSVAFRLLVGDGVTAPNRSLVIRPVLRGTGGECQLPPIIVRGARAGSDAENRAMSAAGVNPDGRYVTAVGTSLDYRADVPWREWMTGAQLVLNGLNAGRDGATEVNLGTVAENLLSEPAGGTAAVPVAASSFGSVGDELAARFSFVEPASRYVAARDASSLDAVFDYNMPLVFGTTDAAAAQTDDDVSRFVDMTRQGAIRIGFARGSNVVDRALGENNKMLVNLISSIRALGDDPGLRISQVVVVGFSAPEGTDERETLALERAQNTRNFITANSKVDSEVISVYNGSIDWVTLRVLVAESNMPDKYKVLEIIDNVPAWGNTQGKDRMTWLMELGGGEPFRYIRANFFPKLRQTGAYVKVYFEGN